MAFTVIEDIGHRATGGFCDSSVLRVIGIRCRSVNRLDTVLGIVGVVVGTVVEQVSGGVVAKTIHAVVRYAVVLGTGESVVRLRSRACRDCLLPAIAVTIIYIAKSLSGRAIRAN